MFGCVGRVPLNPPGPLRPISPAGIRPPLLPVPMSRPWYIREGTFREHLRWGAVSVALLVSMAGLLGLPVTPHWDVAVAMIGAAPLATVIVDGVSRKLHVLLSMFFIAGAIGTFHVAMGWIKAGWTTRAGEAAGSVSGWSVLVYLLYLGVAWVLHARVRIAREKEGI